MTRSQPRRALHLAGLAVLAAIFAVGAARATTITVFSNFSGTPLFNQTSRYFISGSNFANFAEAMPFTAGSTADLADAVLALENFQPTTNSPITLDLESNSSGVPGAILATLTQQGTIPPSTSPGLVTFDYSGASVELTSGTSYWLVATETDANSSQGWSFSNSDTGTFAFNLSGSATGPWTTSSDTNLSAFEVDGSTPTAAAAEPGTLSILAVDLLGGLGVLFWVERRRSAGRYS